MKNLCAIVFVVLAFATTAGCARDAQELLKQRTGLNVEGLHATVTIIDRNDLDEPAYRVTLDEADEVSFLDAVDKASGAFCRRLLTSANACSYRSTVGYDVFILKENQRSYQILTSGGSVGAK